MRPRPVVGEATVPDAVRRLLDKFDYPDREAHAQVLPILPTLGGGPGGAPTIVVAASDASDESKDRADIQATGTDDYAAFQTANDRISAGRILVSEGSFDLGTTEVNLNSGITLQGMGAGATYIYGEAPTMLFDVASQCEIYDIYFDQGTNGAGCVDIVGGQASAIKNCQFENVDSTGWMVRHSASGVLTIEGCFFDGNGDGITTSGNGGRFINVTNNYFLQTNRGLYFPAADIYNIHVIGNTFQQTEEWGLYIDASNGIIIANNDFASCGQTANGALWINTALGTIIGNKFDSTRNGPDIHINGSRQITVVGNTSETAFQDGLLLDASSNCVVADNIWLLDGHDTPNTYDGIRLIGNSDSNSIHENTLTSMDSRYGINIAAATCDNNLIDNNYLSGTFSTAEYNDAGTGTKFGPEGDKWNLGIDSGRVANQVVQWDGTDFILGAVSSGLVDHGGLLGLGDVADHLLYLDLAGTRAMTGALDMGEFGITNVGGVSLDSISPDVDDILFLKGDNSTVWLRWDQANDRPEFASSDVLFSFAIDLGGSRDTYFDNESRPKIFKSGGGAGDFGAQSGHLVLQPRTSTGVPRDFIFGGGSGTAVELARITGGGIVQLGKLAPLVDDTAFLKGDNTTTWLLWDNSDDRAEFETAVTVNGSLHMVGVGEWIGVGGAPNTTDGVSLIESASGDFFRIAQGVNPNAGNTLIQASNGGTANDLMVLKDSSTVVFVVKDGGKVGVGVASPSARLHVDQSSASAAVPVLTLDQADVDQDFFKFIGTSDTNVDRALVDAVDFPNIGAIKGYLKVNVQDDQATNPITDGDYYIPFYAVPTA